MHLVGLHGEEVRVDVLHRLIVDGDGATLIVFM